MSKDNAEQLLNAAMQAEKETKKRMQNESRHSRSRKLEKIGRTSSFMIFISL